MKIAVLFIGIGNYFKFWDGFYSSCKKYFLPQSEKHFYLFTDSKEIEVKQDITVFEEKNYGWPGNTLYRFRMFNRIGDELKGYDWVFFFNANAMFVKEIRKDNFLPSDDDTNIITVGHFRYYKKDTINHNGYERHKKSTAYVKWGKEGKDFVQCCLIGAKGDEFFKFSHELASNIEIDEKNDICAIWHDESHFNKYIIDKNYKLLDLSYASPEAYTNNTAEVNILMRDKTKLGNLNVVRSGKKPSITKRFIQKIKNQNVKISNNFHYFVYRVLKWKK